MQSQKRRSRSRSASERGLEVPAARSSAAAEDGTHQLRRPLLLSAALIAATLLVYAQAWRFGFVLIDDPTYVSENPHVRGGLSMTNFDWSFTTFHDGNWIPLTWLSLMLDTSLFGVQAAGYHSTNVLLHIANALLLFWFLASATGNQLRSACVAALFALHPLHVESVAWITERKDVLSTLFGLLALLTYVRFMKHRRSWSFAACMVCFVASLLSKQSLVTLPFVFLLLDFWPLGRFSEQSSRTRVLVEKIPFFAISAAFSAITIVAQKSGHNVASLTDFPLGTRCMNALIVYAEYFLKTLVPYGLAVFYPYPAERHFWAAVGGAALLLAAISTAALVWVRRYPFLFVGWTWFLGTLVPMIGIVQVGRQQMADRYTYFPLIGLFLAIVWLCAELIPHSALRTRALATTAVAVLAALAGAAFIQAGYWHDSVALFRHARDCDENNPVAASALGSTLGTRGQAAEGLALLEMAVKLAPKDAESHFNLAVGLERLARIDAAIEQYHAALALDDWDARAHNNLGLLFWQRHEYQQAKQHFLRAIEIDRDHVSTYENLGALSGEIGDFDGSIVYNQRALQLDPSLLICHYNIGLALRAQGRLDEAIGQFRYLLSVSPADADARRELERTLAMQRGSGGER
jgi:tetratricopeptide (TPR) repeat protein